MTRLQLCERTRHTQTHPWLWATWFDRLGPKGCCTVYLSKNKTSVFNRRRVGECDAVGHQMTTTRQGRSETQRKPVKPQLSAVPSLGGLEQHSAETKRCETGPLCNSGTGKQHRSHSHGTRVDLIWSSRGEWDTPQHSRPVPTPNAGL